jgi:hypothetical protein
MINPRILVVTMKWYALKSILPVVSGREVESGIVGTIVASHLLSARS